MHKRAGFLLLLLCLASTASADRVDDYLTAAISAHHIPGLAVAVVRDGRVVKTAGYGSANLELAVPVTPDTVFEIGSLTKQFTAVALMMLVEEGKVSLDDPIAKYFPKAPESWKPITVRQLLTHTSGIQEYLGVPDVLAAFHTDMTHERVEELFFSGLPLVFAPGETWAYSNSGYLLLGNIIEKASGQSYFAFLSKRIFEPAGMTATRSTAPRTVIPRRASGYEWVRDHFENRPPLGEDAYAAGAIVSTVGDLAKWDAVLRERRLLTRASYDAIETPARAAGGALAPFDYGFGWFVGTDGGRRVITHSGGTPGFSSTFFRFVDDDLSVILLTNHSDRVLEHLALDVAAMFVPSLAPPEGPKDPDPARTRRVRAALEGLIARNADPQLFTPAMQRFLGTGTGREIFPWAAADGPLRAFTFSGTERVGDAQVVRCEVRLGEFRRWFRVAIAPDGRIAQVQWW